VRVVSVGLKSDQYKPSTLRAIAQQTGGTYAESATPAALGPIFAEISSKLSSEYVITYRSLLPPDVPATVSARVAGFAAPATAKYTTPELVLGPPGDFDKNFVDRTILSPYLMIFVIVSVLALLAFALITAFDVRRRSLKRRMSHYVNVPTEEESHVRRAEVTAMLSERAQKQFASHRWWQSFERDVELADFRQSAITLLGWTVIGGILTSIVFAILLQSLLGLLVGLLAPVVTRTMVSLRVKRKRAAFAEQLPDNLDVLAGALRAGHSLIGAMNVLLEGAAEPSKTEFRRVIQDEQLGVPVDEALQVMATRMQNEDVEQVALVTRLSREAGGNTAEVLDRVVENIRGKMELRRLVQVLTAQGRMARWILTALPLVLVGFMLVINPDWLDPLFETTMGRASLVLWVVLLVIGTYMLRKITEIVV
jgi:tight adherence protein B